MSCIQVSKGGKNTWENLVTACKDCNQRKGNQTLKQLGWRLRTTPREPSPHEMGIVVRHVHAVPVAQASDWHAVAQA
jgi:hypothetical protein